jgi:pilus assembly protein Flp/PilA
MLNLISTYLKHYTKQDEGATAVEYGIMVALIAIVIIVAVALLGTNLESVFSRVASEVGEHT